MEWIIAEMYEVGLIDNFFTIEAYLWSKYLLKFFLCIYIFVFENTHLTLQFLKRLKLFIYWCGMFSKDWHVFDAIISIKIYIRPHICIEYPWKDAPGIGDSICLRVRNKVIRKWGKVAEVIFNSISFYIFDLSTMCMYYLVKN